MLEAKNKFICEEKLLLSLSDETKFLEDKEISKNAQKIIELCRKNKVDRTKLDAFLNEYGLDNKETENFALQCLLARRFAERGVRFIQVSHAHTLPFNLSLIHI